MSYIRRLPRFLRYFARSRALQFLPRPNPKFADTSIMTDPKEQGNAPEAPVAAEAPPSAAAPAPATATESGTQETLAAQPTTQPWADEPLHVAEEVRAVLCAA